MPTKEHLPVPDPVVSPTNPATANLVGDYELLSESRRTPHGVVHMARHVRLNRRVAVLVLDRPTISTSEQDALRQLSTAVRRLRHPHIVRIQQISEQDGRMLLSMDAVNGRPLAEKLARDGVWNPTQAADLVLQIIRILQAAHQAGLTHGDLRPEYILLDTQGTPHLAEIGVTAALGRPHPGSSQGSPSGIAADIQGLGNLLLCLLTGTTDLTPGNPSLSGSTATHPHLASIVERCLHPVSSSAYKSLEQLAADLANWNRVIAHPTAPPPFPNPVIPPLRPPPRPSPPPSPFVLATGVAALLLLSVGLLFKKAPPINNNAGSLAEFDPKRVHQDDRFDPSLRTLQQRIRSQTNDTRVAKALVQLIGTAARIEPDGTAETLGGPLIAWGVDPHGRWLALGTATNDLQVWDLSRQTLHHHLPGALSSVPNFTFAPDGSRLGWLDEQGIHLLDLASGRVQNMAPDPAMPLRQLVLTSDPERILALTENGQIRIVPLEGIPTPLRTPSPNHAVEIQVNSSARWLLSRGPDGSVGLWDAQRGESSAIGPSSATIVAMGFWESARMAILQDSSGGITLWDPGTAREMGRVPAQASAIGRWTGAANGEHLVSWNEAGRVRVTSSAGTFEDFPQAPAEARLKAFAVSPDSQFHLSALSTDSGSELRVRPLRDPAVRTAPLLLDTRIEVAAFTAIGGIVTVDSRGVLQWWRLGLHEAAMLPDDECIPELPVVTEPLPAWFHNWVQRVDARLPVGSGPTSMPNQPPVGDPTELARWARWVDAAPSARPPRWKESANRGKETASPVKVATQAWRNARLKPRDAQAWLDLASALQVIPPHQRIASSREIRHCAARSVELAPDDPAVQRGATAIRLRLDRN